MDRSAKVGPQGPPGANGTNGAAGAPGPVGMGVPGWDGEDAPIEPVFPGPKGDKGDKGDTGAPGSGGQCVRVHHSTTQSLGTSGTEAALAFDTEDFDTDTMHDTATNNSRLTATTAGKYAIIGEAEFAGNVTGLRRVRIRLNGSGGTNLNIQTTMALGNAGIATSLTVADSYNFSANDYVELIARQDSGGALNVNACSFSMYRIA